jgi:hypothetical protein
MRRQLDEWAIRANEPAGEPVLVDVVTQNVALACALLSSLRGLELSRPRYAAHDTLRLGLVNVPRAVALWIIGAKPSHEDKPLSCWPS